MLAWLFEFEIWGLGGFSISTLSMILVNSLSSLELFISEMLLKSKLIALFISFPTYLISLFRILGSGMLIKLLIIVPLKY